MEQSMLARMERQIIMERHHLHLDQISNREPGYLKKPGTLMPASFDNAPPRRSRMKKRREGGGSLVQAYQRRKRIERQNVTLIKRLLNNKYRKTMYGVRKSLGPSSLNATERRTTLLQTVKENNILLKKIKTAPASINPSKWEKEHAQNLIKYKHMSKFHRYDEDVLGKIRRSRRNRRKEQISEKQQQTTLTTLKASPVNKMKKNKDKNIKNIQKAPKSSKASNINKPKSPLTSRPKLKTKSPRVQRTTTHQSKSELHSKEMEGHIRAINTKNIKSNQKILVITFLTNLLWNCFHSGIFIINYLLQFINMCLSFFFLLGVVVRNCLNCTIVYSTVISTKMIVRRNHFFG